MLDTTKVKNCQVVNANGYPDFTNAYIQEAFWEDGTPLSDNELEKLNEDSEFIYQECINKYF